MHMECYVGRLVVVLCMHCKPMVEGDSVVGMQCIQKAIVAVALYMQCDLW